MDTITGPDSIVSADEDWRGRRQILPFRSTGSSIQQSQRRLIIGIMVPTLLFYFLFRYYPVARMFYLSLTDAQLLDPEFSFVGIDNFRMLFSDASFWKILWNTTYYALGSTIAVLIFALALAFVFEPIERGSSLLRLIYFLPSITSMIAIATIWLWLYQPRFGLFNQILGSMGIPPVSWLTSVEWSKPSLIIMSIWGGTGFSALIFIAGLKGIPHEFTEAAVIDGATSLQVVWHIRLPLLTRVISFVAITNFMGGFQIFQQVFLMTQGGPLGSTQVLALEIYQQAFHRLRIGEAAAISFVLFAVVGFLTILYMRLQEVDWEF